MSEQNDNPYQAPQASLEPWPANRCVVKNGAKASLQIIEPREFGLSEIVIGTVVSGIRGVVLVGCVPVAICVLGIAVLPREFLWYVPVASGGVSWAAYGFLLYFFPVTVGNPFVKRLVRRFPQDGLPPGMVHICQLTFRPRLYGGLRARLDDADDVGRLSISEDALHFWGDHVRLSLAFEAIRDFSHSSSGGRGLWLVGRRIRITTDAFEGCEGIEFAERESNTVVAARRISREIIERLREKLPPGVA